MFLRRAQSQGLLLRERSLHGAETNGDWAIPGTEENSDFHMDYLDQKMELGAE